MSGQCPSLSEALAQVQDLRKARGKRHPLAAILALAVAATLCGAQGYGAMAEWGRDHGDQLARALGFTREKTPCAGTLHYLFARLDRMTLERCSPPGPSRVGRSPPAQAHPEALAIDGKTLRGSKQQGALDVHLVSMLSHRLGLTLYEQAVSDKTNEIGRSPRCCRPSCWKGASSRWMRRTASGRSPNRSFLGGALRPDREGEPWDPRCDDRDPARLAGRRPRGAPADRRAGGGSQADRAARVDLQ